MSVIVSKGTLLEMRVNGSTTSYSAVDEVLTVSGPDGSAEDIDVTNLGSTSNSRNFVQGYIDQGSINFSISYDPANATHASSNAISIPTFYTAGTSGQFRIKFGGSTSKIMVFTGPVRSFNPNFDVGSQITADVSVKLSGAPTFP